MARNTLPRHRRHRARPRFGSLLAVILFLAVALVLVRSETSLAISGFATDGPAVRAQYPDAAGMTPEAPVVATLQVLVNRARASKQNPEAAAQRRADERAIRREATAALSSSAGLGRPGSGSIGLLLAGLAVASVALVLRWGRGVAQV